MSLLKGNTVEEIMASYSEVGILHNLCYFLNINSEFVDRTIAEMTEE